MNINKLYALFEQCSGVTTDSRKVATDNMFVALRGANFNGNLYAAMALEAGAAYAVVDSLSEDFPAQYRDRVVVVEDTLATLQALAAHHRRQLQIPIIGIVGSNGKTTTKELTSRVLAERFTLYATQGNLNNHIGVPLTLLAMDSTIEFGVVRWVQVRRVRLQPSALSVSQIMALSPTLATPTLRALEVERALSRARVNFMTTLQKMGAGHLWLRRMRF